MKPRQKPRSWRGAKVIQAKHLDQSLFEVEASKSNNQLMLGPHPNPFTTTAMSVCQHQYKLSLVLCPLVCASRVPPEKAGSHIQYSSHKPRRQHQLGARGHKEGWGNRSSDAFNRSQIGISKSSPQFSPLQKKNITMALFQKLLLLLLSLPTLTYVFIQSTSLGSAMSLSHSEKNTILLSEPFSDCLTLKTVSERGPTLFGTLT